MTPTVVALVVVVCKVVVAIVVANVIVLVWVVIVGADDIVVGEVDLSVLVGVNRMVDGESVGLAKVVVVEAFDV